MIAFPQLYYVFHAFILFKTGICNVFAARTHARTDARFSRLAACFVSVHSFSIALSARERRIFLLAHMGARCSFLAALAANVVFVRVMDARTTLLSTIWLLRPPVHRRQCLRPRASYSSARAHGRSLFLAGCPLFLLVHFLAPLSASQRLPRSCYSP